MKSEERRSKVLGRSVKKVVSKRREGEVKKGKRGGRRK